jgi:cation transport regulator ChaB
MAQRRSPEASKLDRGTRLILAHAVVERTRDFTDEAFNDVFEALDEIERRRGLVPKLTAAEEAAVAAAEQRLARGERLPELELRGRVEDLLPESFESILTRLAARPETEQDSVFDMISLLIDIDRPRPRPSPEQIASLRRFTRRDDE